MTDNVIRDHFRSNGGEPPMTTLEERVGKLEEKMSVIETKLDNIDWKLDNHYATKAEINILSSEFHKANTTLAWRMLGIAGSFTAIITLAIKFLN